MAKDFQSASPQSQLMDDPYQDEIKPRTLSKTSSFRDLHSFLKEPSGQSDLTFLKTLVRKYTSPMAKDQPDEKYENELVSIKNQLHMFRQKYEDLQAENELMRIRLIEEQKER